MKTKLVLNQSCILTFQVVSLKLSLRSDSPRARLTETALLLSERNKAASSKMILCTTTYYTQQRQLPITQLLILFQWLNMSHFHTWVLRTSGLKRHCWRCWKSLQPTVIWVASRRAWQEKNKCCITIHTHITNYSLFCESFEVYFTGSLESSSTGANVGWWQM